MNRSDVVGVLCLLPLVGGVAGTLWWFTTPDFWILVGIIVGCLITLTVVVALAAVGWEMLFGIDDDG